MSLRDAFRPDLFGDDSWVEAANALNDLALREVRAQADAEAKSGYYLRDEHTGEKIYMKAQPVDRCQALKLGRADKWCERCTLERRAESAIVCMWKAEWGNPFDLESWMHLCAEHAREAGLPV